MAAVLLIVIGVSGLLVGVALLAIVDLSKAAGQPAMVAIPAGICAYGAAAIIGGSGIFLRRRWAHRLSVVVIAACLSELTWQTTLIGPDPVTLFGVALWGLVLILLLLPEVRSTFSST